MYIGQKIKFKGEGGSIPSGWIGEIPLLKHGYTTIPPNKREGVILGEHNGYWMVQYESDKRYEGGDKIVCLGFKEEDLISMEEEYTIY